MGPDCQQLRGLCHALLDRQVSHSTYCHRLACSSKPFPVEYDLLKGGQGVSLIPVILQARLSSSP